MATLFPKVYCFLSPTCSACTEARPHVEAFTEQVAGRAFVVTLNPNLKEYEFAGKKVRYTPTYVFFDQAGNPVEMVEGRVLTAEQLEEYAFTPPPPPEKKRRGKQVLEDVIGEELPEEEESNR